MLKENFQSESEFDKYLIEQKKRMELKYLTYSERNQLKKMLDPAYKPIIKIPQDKFRLITDLNILKIPCQDIIKEDDVDDIVNHLKTVLAQYNGYGLAANQIGINKKIAYIKCPPKYDMITKQWDCKEIILINPKIIECDRAIKIKQEGCLSIPHLKIDTKRFVFLTFINHDKNFQEQILIAQDLEAFIISHETDHLYGKTILDRKWKCI